MDKIQFKAKFFGTKERKGQIKKQAEFVMAVSEDKVEDALRLQGWQTIHGLKIGTNFDIYTGKAGIGKSSNQP